jgi:hypothetical protein
MLQSNPQVRGLFSSVGEWTGTPGILYPGSPAPHTERARLSGVIRGIPPSVAFVQPSTPFEEKLGARIRSIAGVEVVKKTIGVRFARSAKPRMRAEDFGK